MGIIPISEDIINGKNSLRFKYENKIKSLIATYGWKALPKAESEEVRKFYWDVVGELDISYPQEIVSTLKGTPISDGFTRVVVGDYGAYIEFDESQIIDAYTAKKIVCKKGQEGRIYGTGKYEHCKYYWLTIEDGSDIKIYLQTRPVAYADYKPGMYYVGIFDCMTLPF